MKFRRCAGWCSYGSGKWLLLAHENFDNGIVDRFVINVNPQGTMETCLGIFGPFLFLQWYFITVQLLK